MFYIRERYESSLKFIKRLICMPSRFLKPHDRGAESDVDEKITERKRERQAMSYGRRIPRDRISCNYVSRKF